MRVVYVYADVVMLVSIFATVPMLWGAARAYGLKFRFFRATLASLFNGITTLATILLRLNYIVMLLCAVPIFFILLYITFGRLKMRTMLHATGMLFAETALLSGACTLINDVFSSEARSFMSIGCMICGVIFLVAALRIRRSAYSVSVEAASVQNYSLLLSFGTKTVQLTAVLDTGNLLTEPLSQNPVIILNRALATQKLNEDVVTPIETNSTSRIRIVPYRGAASDGVMLCVKAKEVKILEHDEWQSVGDVYVGISENIACDALIGTELLNRVM